eukprot:s1042_g7.t1
MRGRNDDEGCEACVGAGQLEGFFNNSSLESERRGWGHLVSTYFQGTLFFHLQRSPALRGVDWARYDVVFFEVMEINGRYEAVKMLLPSMMETQGSECKAEAHLEQFEGQRIQGKLRSQWQLVKEKKWGFVSCHDLFPGNVFWHLDENPKMKDVKFQRGDLVEFEVYTDSSRGEKSQEFLQPAEKEEQQKIRSKYLSPSKLLKKQQWIDNWRAGPPPDWTCKGCGYHNFGRNKICKTCDTKRPPREEWPEEKEEELQKAVAPNIPLLPAAFQANLPVQFQSFAQKPLEVRRNFVDGHDAAASRNDEAGTTSHLSPDEISLEGMWETDMMLDAAALGIAGLQTDTLLDATALGTTGLPTDTLLDATALDNTALQMDTLLDATALGTTGLQADTLLDATALGNPDLQIDSFLDATALGTTGLQADTLLDATALNTTALQMDTFLDASALGTTGLQTDTTLDALGTTGWQAGATPDATDWHRDTAQDASGWKTDAGWNRNTTQDASGWQRASGWDANGWRCDANQHATAWQTGADASGWQDAQGLQTNSMAATSPILAEHGQPTNPSSQTAAAPFVPEPVNLPRQEIPVEDLRRFENVLSADLSEQELVASIKTYLAEVNKSLGLDRAKKQEFAANLAKHPWFPHTGYEVRYRPAANSVEIALSPAARAQKRQRVTYGAVEPTAVRIPIESLEDPPSFEVATVELFGPFQVLVDYKDGQQGKVIEAINRMPNHLTAGIVSNNPIFINEVLGNSITGTTYAGARARTTGAPVQHWFGPSGIHTKHAIQLCWSSHRERLGFRTVARAPCALIFRALKMLAHRDKERYLAHLAALAERYDEVIEHMKQVIQTGPQLSVEERNLLSVAYKNKVGMLRSAFRASQGVAKDASRDEAQYAEEYQKKAQEEGIRSCEDIIALLEDLLLPNASEAEMKVFFLKNRADYYRYIAEFRGTDHAVAQASEVYQEAIDAVQEHLAATHPIRLGMALSRAVFSYEILNLKLEACSIARKAFDDGLKELDEIPEEHYKDSTQILQMLRDQLTQWTSAVE